MNKLKFFFLLSLSFFMIKNISAETTYEFNPSWSIFHKETSNLRPLLFEDNTLRDSKDVITLKNKRDLGLTVYLQKVKNDAEIILHAGHNDWIMLPNGAIVLKNNPKYGLTVYHQNIKNDARIILHTGYNYWKVLPNGAIVLKNNPSFGLTVNQQNLKNNSLIILHKGYNQWAGNVVDKVNPTVNHASTTVAETGFRVMLNGLHCLQSADDGNGTDEPYFEIFVDGSKSPRKTGRRPMNEADRSYWEKFTDNIEAATRIAQQEFWLMPISVYAEREVRVVLWEEDDGRGDSPFVNNDDYIGEFVIKKSESNGNYKLKKFRSSEEGNWNVVYTKTTRPKYDKSLNGTAKRVNVRVPILDQGNEGACVAFATVGALTTSYLNKTKAGSSKEELFDPFKLYARRSNTNTSGWNIDRCLNEILKDGIPFKSNTSRKLRLKNYYEYHKDGRIIKVTYSSGRINRSTVSAADGNGYNKMRAVLKSGEPLIARYDVYPDFMAYAGIQGVYGGKIAETNSRSGGHAVFVVGYKNPSLKSNSFPTWTLQNSWAPRWGKNGLCEFAEGACGFDRTMYRVGDFY